MTAAPRDVKPPAALAAPPEAARIHGENLRAWIAKLEREAARTGNARLAAQARELRAKFPT